MNVPDARDQPTMKVEDAGAAFGLGRSASYAAVERGDFPCPVLKIGRRYCVPTAGVRRALLLDEVPERDETPPASGASVTELAGRRDRSDAG